MSFCKHCFLVALVAAVTLVTAAVKNDVSPTACASLIWIANTGSVAKRSAQDLTFIPKLEGINYGLVSYPSKKHGTSTQACYTSRLRPVADFALLQGVSKLMPRDQYNVLEGADIAALEYVLKLNLSEKSSPRSAPVIVLSSDTLSTEKTPCSAAGWGEVVKELVDRKFFIFIDSTSESAGSAVVETLKSLGFANSKVLPSESDQAKVALEKALNVACEYHTEGRKLSTV
eukprot:Lankesteria_metandrocarpae@DN3325_c0_g1_i1.p1